jgi:hypothetical protein
VEAVVARSKDLFLREGFVVIPDVIDESDREALISHLKSFALKGAGSRSLLTQPWCADLAQQLRRHDGLKELLPADAVALQCTLFDKSPTKNWLVALHQDLSIPVNRRIDSIECSGWSEKEGRVYVQPPVKVLEQLLAIRVHVDACPATSGALRVVPRSHRWGRLDVAPTEQTLATRTEVVVPVSMCGALFMRPLLLHASSKASVPNLRRVLHFVFGPAVLPLGLEWPSSASPL